MLYVEIDRTFYRGMKMDALMLKVFSSIRGVAIK